LQAMHHDSLTEDVVMADSNPISNGGSSSISSLDHHHSDEHDKPLVSFIPCGRQRLSKTLVSPSASAAAFSSGAKNEEPSVTVPLLKSVSSFDITMPSLICAFVQDPAENSLHASLKKADQARGKRKFLVKVRGADNGWIFNTREEAQRQIVKVQLECISDCLLRFTLPPFWFLEAPPDAKCAAPTWNDGSVPHNVLW
jgi:hypothetical protein